MKQGNINNKKQCNETGKYQRQNNETWKYQQHFVNVEKYFPRVLHVFLSSFGHKDILRSVTLTIKSAIIWNEKITDKIQTTIEKE